MTEFTVTPHRITSETGIPRGRSDCGMCTRSKELQVHVNRQEQRACSCELRPDADRVARCHRAVSDANEQFVIKRVLLSSGSRQPVEHHGHRRASGFEALGDDHESLSVG